MANEHILMVQKTFPISMTVSDGDAIEKGTALTLSDPNTAAAATTAGIAVAGIAYTEKVANDGNTLMSVLSGPGDELKAIASGSIAIGDPLAVAGSTFPNTLYAATTDLSGSAIIGHSKEAVADTESFKYVLQIGTGAGAA